MEVDVMQIHSHTETSLRGVFARGGAVLLTVRGGTGGAGC